MYLADDINLVDDGGCRLLQSTVDRTLCLVVPRTRNTFGDKSSLLRVRRCGTLYTFLQVCNRASATDNSKSN